MRSPMFAKFNGAQAAREAQERAEIDTRVANAEMARLGLEKLSYGEALRIVQDVIVTRKDATPLATREFAQTVDRYADELERI